MKSLPFCLIFCIGLIFATEPTVEGIDYTAPTKYLEIKDSLGTPEKIETLTAELKGESDHETIRNVLAWMDDNLRHDGDQKYVWRNFDDVLEEKAYLCCADQGMFCGVLLKKAGIPTIWVKTMDVSWIWDFKMERPFEAYSGHVFLEVFVEDRWMLLDPAAKALYKKYSPDARLLPGNRFSYHKGDDPKEMIMSLQWEKWKKQTTAYFTDLDESLLPVDSSERNLLKPDQAFIVGNSPRYKELAARAQENGFHVTLSFNADYDRNLIKAKGHLLLIETHNGKPIIPREVLEKHFPRAFEALEKPDRTTKIAGTNIVFFDFNDPSSRLEIKAEE